jgi:hypothetical protein
MIYIYIYIYIYIQTCIVHVCMYHVKKMGHSNVGMCVRTWPVRTCSSCVLHVTENMHNTHFHTDVQFDHRQTLQNCMTFSSTTNNRHYTIWLQIRLDSRPPPKKKPPRAHVYTQTFCWTPQDTSKSHQTVITNPPPCTYTYTHTN